jgi:flavin prenyltransferase
VGKMMPKSDARQARGSIWWPSVGDSAAGPPIVTAGGLPWPASYRQRDESLGTPLLGPRIDATVGTRRSLAMPVGPGLRRLTLWRHGRSLSSTIAISPIGDSLRGIDWCSSWFRRGGVFMATTFPLIVGISGASGAIYGVRFLEALHANKIPAHLIVSKSAALTLKEEVGTSIDQVRGLAEAAYQNADIGAAISSGSFKTRGMVIIPCSIRTLSDIAYGTTGSLLSRAADVTLKERRRLVLVVRETPLHAGHLRSMLAATENGAIIAPPVPAFYHRPDTIDDIVNQTVGRCLDLFDIDIGLVKRWRTETGA